jgi:Cu+-exporting ATPase
MTGHALTTDQSPTSTTRIELSVGGMTCASCAMRIEKKLNRLDGVAATVNYATETATVNFDPVTVTPDVLIATVEATGYTAKLPLPPTKATPEDSPDAGRNDEADSLRQRLIVSATLSVPVVVMARSRSHSSASGSGLHSHWPPL